MQQVSRKLGRGFKSLPQQSARVFRLLFERLVLFIDVIGLVFDRYRFCYYDWLGRAFQIKERGCVCSMQLLCWQACQIIYGYQLSSVIGFDKQHMQLALEVLILVPTLKQIGFVFARNWKG
eukprot:TRINITY_DN1832_c0_g2_i13.p15 TRINITY_DN1832_c0_g2~~TRINITY_DN1832_c0_g2_i13.p15  ORF type:complete len:121 (-),score=3.87 TRINITY_DN1832_c0_g2_i13:58-420(-)